MFYKIATVQYKILESGEFGKVQVIRHNFLSKSFFFECMETVM